MRKKVIYFLFFFHTQILFSQNLIPNSGFENYSDELIRQHGLLTIYFNQTGWKSFGSIDLFSRVNETVPCNQFGKTCPVSGKAYMGMNAAYPREIAQTPLKKSLEKNKTYCISFYVSTSFKTDTAVKLRVLFSDTLVVNFSGFVFFPKTIALTECATEMDSWKKVSAVYKADGGEKYFIIGNFDDEHDPVKSKNHTWHDSYYFVDDVSVKELNSGESCDCNAETISEFFPLENEKCKCALTPLKIERKPLPVNVFFETAEHNLDQSALLKLDSLIGILNQKTKLKAVISGYADVDGTEAGNKDLSVNRAKAVADYFIKKGIETERISFKGYGSSGTAASEEIKSRNRKTEIRIE